MKTTTFFLLFIFVSVFYSCDNDGVESLTSYEIEKLESLKNLKGESQVIAFKMLSKETKFNFWLEKLGNLQKNNELNNSQKTFINELISTLRIEYFENNAVLNNPNYYNNYLKDMKIVASMLFTQEQMKSFFASIDSSYSNTTSKSPSFEGGESSICNCNSADDWCIWGSSCFVWSCERHVGCGWWLQEVCNGLCVSNP